MSNPLLKNVKLPGRVFQLPSKGLFYVDVLRSDVIDGEIMVSPMSALAEMKLRSPDLLFSGKVIREVCEECIPQILKPEMLVSQDVDALFAFLKVATYGTTHILTSEHDCKNSKAHEYTINLEELLHNAHNKVLDHKDALYSQKLSNGQIVLLKPNTYIDAMKVMHIKQAILKDQAQGTPTETQNENVTIMDMLAVIHGVEVVSEDNKTIRVTDVAHLTEWIRALPSVLFKEVIDAAKRANDWGYKFTTKIKCRDCGKTYDHDLEIDPINFFFG